MQQMHLRCNRNATKMHLRCTNKCNKCNKCTCDAPKMHIKCTAYATWTKKKNSYIAREDSVSVRFVYFFSGLPLEQQREATPLPHCRLQRDVSPVSVHNLAAETQSDARTAGFGGEERHEHLVLYVGQNALAVVAHVDEAFPREGSGGSYFDGRLLHLGTCLACVLDEVNEHLLHLGAVDVQGDVFGRDVDVDIRFRIEFA